MDAGSSVDGGVARVLNEPRGLGVRKAVVLKQGISAPPCPPGGHLAMSGDVYGCLN